MIAHAMPAGDMSSLAWEYETPGTGGIVVGIDGSRESIAAMNTGASLARARRCPLHIVSVLPHLPAPVNTPADASSPNKDDLRISLRSSELEDLLTSLEPRENWTCETVIGRPARELASIAERRCAYLMILGRRSHGPMDRILGTETPLQEMRTASVTVLVVESDIEKLRTIG
jgi:nucleotide-binding universal stress UspA family protein